MGTCLGTPLDPPIPNVDFFGALRLHSVGPCYRVVVFEYVHREGGQFSSRSICIEDEQENDVLRLNGFASGGL